MDVIIAFNVNKVYLKIASFNVLQFQYILESFTETRATKWTVEPYQGK